MDPPPVGGASAGFGIRQWLDEAASIAKAIEWNIEPISYEFEPSLRPIEIKRPCGWSRSRHLRSSSWPSVNSPSSRSASAALILACMSAALRLALAQFQLAGDVGRAPNAIRSIEATGIHHLPRRRGGMAAHGARPAAGDAGRLTRNLCPFLLYSPLTGHFYRAYLLYYTLCYRRAKWRGNI
jgi:hypothetical protein